MLFPSLIGGSLVPADFAPSIIFALLFASLIPVAICRLAQKCSRTLIIVGPLAFTIERVVIFSLRAMQARDSAQAGSPGLATYEQLTIGVGFITICQALVNLLRVLLVNATRPCSNGNTESTPDRPRERASHRRLARLLGLSFFAAFVLGLFSGNSYSTSQSPTYVATLSALRYASTGMTLVPTVLVGAVAWAALNKVDGMKRRPALILVVLGTLITSVPIYRLSVMHFTAESLVSRAPGSLSSPLAKAFFYIFHMLPEWLVSAALIGLNVREIFDTGLHGDRHSSDKESRWARWKRERKGRKENQKVQGDSTELVMTV